MQHKSFWTSRDTREYAALRGRITADVAVVGGGLSGLTIAAWLSRAGLRVTLLEAERLGWGATAQCAGLVSLAGGVLYSGLESHVADAYAHTQKSALNAVRGLAEENGLDCPEMDVSLLVEKGREKALEQETDAMQRAGVSAEYVRGGAYADFAPASLRLDRMFALHPLYYAECLAALLEGNGGKLFDRSRVRGLEINEVYTERGTVQAPYLVIATGYPIVNVPGWYFLRLRQRECGLTPLAGQATFHGAFAALDGSFTLRPLAHGALLQTNGGYTGAREDLRARGAALAARLGMQTVEETYVGLEGCTPDGLPFIGTYGRKTPNLFVAAGYGGRGILGAMVAAQAISARILGLPSDGYEIYSGQRGIKSARMPLGIAGRSLQGLVSRPSAPRCPHMGCRLAFNPMTRLWECPCHGSRFDDIGHIVNAPAVRDAVLQNRR